MHINRVDQLECYVMQNGRNLPSGQAIGIERIFTLLLVWEED